MIKLKPCPNYNVYHYEHAQQNGILINQKTVVQWITIFLGVYKCAPEVDNLRYFIPWKICIHSDSWFMKIDLKQFALDRVNGFNVVYQQFIVMYDSGCPICCNWSKLKPGFNLPAHWSSIPQITHTVTLNWHWANQPCSRP